MMVPHTTPSKMNKLFRTIFKLIAIDIISFFGQIFIELGQKIPDIASLGPGE